MNKTHSLSTIFAAFIAMAIPASANAQPLYPAPPAAAIGAGTLDDCSGAPAPGPFTLDRVTIPTATGDIDAVCLDGSPSVMYIAPGSNGDENKWIIVFEGGGSGFNAAGGGLTAADDLAEGLWGRYTGNDGKLLSNRWKVSTDWLTFAGGGVAFGRDGIVEVPSDLRCQGALSGNSPFATWTRVFINYCSSDLWAGDGYIDVPASGVRPDASFQLRGARIVERTFDLLHQDGTGGTFLTDNGNSITLDIDNATDVLLAGESAGSDGVLHNADAVASSLPPMANVRYSMGAHAKPLTPVCGVDSWFTDRDANTIDDQVDGMTHTVEQLQVLACVTSPCYQIDDSCETSLGPAAADLATCMSTFEMLAAGELDNPVFVKQDLSDIQVANAYACTGCGCAPFTSPTAADFAIGVSATIDERIANAWTSGGVGVSYFLPDCGGHETLTGNRFFNDEIEYSTTTYRYSYATALDDFMAGYSVVAEAGDGNWKAGCF